ncbi:histone H1-like [Rhineura floridana]|uniref:histone H1-like n=1 Tax=Rhineura floridana TaxID=261503 RepID=UPI002AC8585E|nr:histone H1-like [Rhineura floridana]
MTEEVSAAPAAALPAVKAPAKKAKKATGGPKSRKLSGPSVTELLTQAVAASKERGGVSLAALKKSLAASGYDVEKNNSRIKLGLKSLVTKGTLLQTKGTGASGSFKLNKKQAEDKGKAAKKQQAPAAAASKAKKPAAKKPTSAAAKKVKKAVGAVASKKNVKVTKKPVGGAKKAAKSPKKPKAAKAKKIAKSPAKLGKAKVKPKAKMAKPKKAASKKK